MKMNKRLHLTINGRVQGVGFRSFVEDEADQLGLTGWVRNLYSGEVEVIAEGQEKDLSSFFERMKIGPSLCHIIEIKSEWLTATSEFRSFNIRSTYVSD